MFLSPTTKNKVQGREWGRGGDSEKFRAEGRSKEERRGRTKEEGLME